MSVCVSWLQPISVGTGAFTATATVFGLLAALSDRYEIAPIALLKTHEQRRLALLVLLATNAFVALLHPLFAAFFLASVLMVLAWRLQPSKKAREEKAALAAAIEEVAPAAEKQLAVQAIRDEAQP